MSDAVAVFWWRVGEFMFGDNKSAWVWIVLAVLVVGCYVVTEIRDRRKPK